MVAPYLIEQLCAGVYTLRVRQKKMQKPKFRGAEFNRAIVQRHFMTHRVEHQAARRQRRVRCMRRTPPQHRLYARHQLARAERFDHVIVGTLIEAFDAISLFSARRHNNQGQICRARGFAQLARQRQPRFVG